MVVTDRAAYRVLETPEEVAETRLEGIGFLFHGVVPDGAPGEKRATVKAGSNLLHFARCARIEKAAGTETKIWFRSIRVAKEHLDGAVGPNRWKWCKVCEREVTQKVLNEP